MSPHLFCSVECPHSDVTTNVGWLCLCSVLMHITSASLLFVTSPTLHCMSFCTPFSFATFLLCPLHLSTPLIALTSVPGVRCFHCVIACNILCHSHNWSGRVWLGFKVHASIPTCQFYMKYSSILCIIIVAQYCKCDRGWCVSCDRKPQWHHRHWSLYLLPHWWMERLQAVSPFQWLVCSQCSQCCHSLESDS